MSKLEKGQNINKTAEETAVELDGEMSMDAKLIGKFITKQVAFAMAKKTKSTKRISRNLRKAEETECRKSRQQKTIQGAVDAPPRKRKYPRLKRPPSQDHLRNMSLDRYKAERVSFEAPQGDDTNK